MSNTSISSQFTPEEHAVALIFQRDFERSGIDLPSSKRSEFVSLSSQIISLGRSFLMEGPGPRGHVDIPILTLRSSVGKDLHAGDLVAKGRVKDLLDALGKRVSRLTGRVRVYGNTWEAHMLMKYCADESIRRDCYIASNKENKGNVQTLDEILRSRARLATLVGKSSYAEMTLSDKMAKTPGAFLCIHVIQSTT